jgi:DNA-binding NarL/FixJ family response regulator
MRPRKKLLLICVDEDVTAMRRLLFWLRHYAVTHSDAPGEMALQAAAGLFDIAVVELDGEGRQGAEAVAVLAEAAPHMPIVLAAWRAAPGSLAHRASLLLGKESSLRELVDRVRIMAQRKRGPRAERTWKTPAQYLAGARRRADRLKAAGLCVTCGLDKQGVSTSRCEICMRKQVSGAAAVRAAKNPDNGSIRRVA